MQKLLVSSEAVDPTLIDEHRTKNSELKKLEAEIEAELEEKLANPTVGMYANHHGWTDVNPYEIIEVKSPAMMKVRAMNAEICKETKPEFVAGGFSAVCINNAGQRWLCTSDPAGEVVAIRKHSDGTWKDRNGRKFKISDKPSKFYDYNF
jgi:hypothetical protein